MDFRRAIFVVFTAPNLFCLAQSMRPDDLAAGKILVMPSNSRDPLFAKSVVALVNYSQSGALGLMIHYPSDLKVSNALEGIKGAEKRSDTLFVGGPVELPKLFGLLRSASPPDGGHPVAGNLYLMASRESIGSALSAGRTAAELRIFIGYTGWEAGQLDQEVSRSGWYIFDYDPNLFFDEHPETLWSRLIAKAERHVALSGGGKLAITRNAEASSVPIHQGQR